MRRPQGYAVVTDPDKPVVEMDTINCRHCSRVMFIRAREDPFAVAGFCRMCMMHICGPCADAGVCVPFEKRLEEEERRERFAQAAGLER